MEAEEISRKIRESDSWDLDLLYQLCDLAGMGEEFRNADGDSFEGIAFEAAKKLDVEI